MLLLSTYWVNYLYFLSELLIENAAILIDIKLNMTQKIATNVISYYPTNVFYSVEVEG